MAGPLRISKVRSEQKASASAPIFNQVGEGIELSAPSYLSHDWEWHLYEGMRALFRSFDFRAAVSRLPVFLGTFPVCLCDMCVARAARVLLGVLGLRLAHPREQGPRQLDE